MLEVAGGILLALLAIPAAVAFIRFFPYILVVAFAATILLLSQAHGTPI